MVPRGWMTHFILFAPKAFDVAPCRLVHCVSVAQVGGRLVVLPGCRRILLDAPAPPKTIGKLKHSQNELAFCRTALFHACLQRQRLDLGAVRCCVREICDRQLRIGRAAPAVSASHDQQGCPYPSQRDLFCMKAERRGSRDTHRKARPYSTWLSALLVPLGFASRPNISVDLSRSLHCRAVPSAYARFRMGTDSRLTASLVKSDCFLDIFLQWQAA